MKSGIKPRAVASFGSNFQFRPDQCSKGPGRAVSWTVPLSPSAFSQPVSTISTSTIAQLLCLGWPPYAGRTDPGGEGRISRNRQSVRAVRLEA